MEIPGGNLFTIAPGTSTSPIRPELELTPEESNEVVDRTLDTIDEVQSSQQASQDITQQAFVGLVEAQLQQNNIERFIEASTDQEVDNSNLANVSDLAEAQQLNETVTSLQKAPSAPESESLLANNTDNSLVRLDQENQQEQLQERIENIVDDGVKIQPVIDLLV